jgi:NAD(P)-dependent dehydrogenase (short-subunit alcohol dehydrogenase family)
VAAYDFRDKVAIVTGASAGLGVQFADALAECGAAVVLVARRAELLEEVARGIRERRGVAALAMPADVRNEAEVVAVVEATTRELGRLDVLVNNAGRTLEKSIVEQTLEDWRLVVDTNLTSAFLASREAAKAMIPQRSGSIVNVTSIFAHRASVGWAEPGYCASKAGLTGLTRALAMELGKFDVRVNAIAPGFFPTDMGAGMTDEIRERLIEPHMALSSRSRNEWIRGSVCFLASDDSRFITGQTLAVDGGWTAG